VGVGRRTTREKVHRVVVTGGGGREIVGHYFDRTHGKGGLIGKNWKGETLF